MKSIAIILDSLNLGGAERQSITLAKELQKKGYQIKIIGLGITGNAVPLLEELSLDYDNLNMSLYTHHPKVIRSSKKILKKHLKKLKADVILPYTYWPNLYANMVWRKVGAEKCFWNQRDVNLNVGKYKNEDKLVKGAAKLIGNSQFCLTMLTEKLNLSGIDEKVIRNGISSELIESRIIDNSSLKSAIMVANIQRNKDHDTLIRAWKLLFEEIGDNCPVLKLAGAKRDTFEALNDLVNQLEIQSKVKFLGMVTDVRSELLNSDFCVFSSNAEGSPNGVLEAMAVGLPVIATDIPPIAELLESNDYLVEKESPTSFAMKILKSLLEKENFILSGVMNKQKVKDNFSIDSMVNDYINLFEE